jgi:hypothetical protein
MTGRVAPSAKWGRNREIVRMHKSGVRVKDIAAKYGISGVRVGQIVVMVQNVGYRARGSS